MSSKLIDRLNNSDNSIPIIAITGLCKNAGKTSLLNWIVSNIPDNEDVVLMTTGRDGEDFDQVGGHEKPKVLVPKGTIFVTHDGVLSQFGERIEVLEKTDYKAGPYRVWVARALDSLKTEIIGPSTAKEQIELSQELKKYKPAKIFIDGSLDRKAITLHPEVDEIIVVLSANFGSIDNNIEELSRLLLLTQIRTTETNNIAIESLSLIKENKIIKSWDSLLGNEEEFVKEVRKECPEYILIPGVVTNSVWEKISKQLIDFGGAVIVNHPYQLQLRKFELEQLINTVNIKCVHEFEISGIGINSYSVKGKHLDSDLFRSRIRELCDLPIVDSMEILNEMCK